MHHLSGKYKSSATVIPLDQAVGKVLAHDITEIRTGEFKGAALKKGHIVREEDIPHLRRLGKEHLFVLHLEPGEVHEDDAAQELADVLSGPGVVHDGKPSEGKIALKAAHKGLLKVHVEALTELSLIPEICCSSLHNNTVVEKGQTLAATRAIPLIISEQTLRAATSIAQACGGIFSVKRLSRPEADLISTGNEVFKGLIKDQFASVLERKLQPFGCRIRTRLTAPDDRSEIAGRIETVLRDNAGLILVTGGMSVDPDDVSRMAIQDAGAEDVVYGTPVLPGAMFLYGRFGNVPVLGLPACVLYHQTTVFDLMLPRVLAGERITRRDLAGMAHGGLCLNCKECRYPICPFGK